MSRIAFISDIHGNLMGLKAVLCDAEMNGCNQIICLGDLVDGGPHNAEVVYEIINRQIPTVRGNHDETNDLGLSPEIKQYLISLPEERIDGEFFYTHISPRTKKRKIVDPFEAWNVFDEYPYRLVFFGHIHVPIIFGERCNKAVTAREHVFEYNQPYILDPTDRYIICPGAVGYSRDAIKKIRYAIFDDEAWSVEMRIIDGPLLDVGHRFID